MNTDHVPRPRKSDERDHVDGFLEEISDDLPDHLDLTVEGIVDRIGGINHRIKRMHNETLEELALTLSDWHVLTALRWSGATPRRTSPHGVGRRSIMSTSAGGSAVSSAPAA